MNDEEKTRDPLIEELKHLRGKVAELEKLEGESKRTGEALRESEEKWRALVQHAPNIILSIDPDCIIQYINRTVPPYTPQTAIGKSIFEFLSPDSQERIARTIRSVFESGNPAQYETRGIGPDGAVAWYDTHIGPLWHHGRVTGVALISTDITERKQAEEKLRQSEERNEALLAAVPDIIMEVDTAKVYTWANEAGLEFFGHDVIGKEASFYFEGEQETYGIVQPLFEGAENVIYVESWQRRKDGEKRLLAWWCRVLKDSSGNVTGALSTARDITERKRAEDALRESEQRLRELSITDELTGLANRRHFYEVLETELERVKRYGGAASLALIDLDGFKEYNDRYGHVNADEVLKAFAAMLRSHLRKADRVFRYGGDEFAMILPHTSDEKAWQVLDRLRGRWDRSGREGLLMTADVNLSFSAGIVQLLKNAESADALVFLADASLYFAKSWGGHRTTLATEMNMPLPEVAGTGISAHVYALAATVDSRDPHTYGHSTRVAELTALIGKSIELTEQETVQLHSASLLHDIGKIGIPDSLLTTWRSLTADERRLMQKHSTEGAKIVGHVRGLTELVPSILHHHERYDGRGYPDGLKGEETPLYARIIAIADAYDTMTTKRLYRRAISRESALQELRKHAGTQFDPVLVDAFCRAMEREESAVSPGDVPGFRSPRGIGDAAR